MLSTEPGIVIPVKDFNPTRIRDVSEQIIQSKEMSANAAVLRAELARAGGISVITREIGN